ncbi:MAG: T9SS type A sorting domain-containing protein [Bacteroidota bacterium]
MRQFTLTIIVGLLALTFGFSQTSDALKHKILERKMRTDLEAYIQYHQQAQQRLAPESIAPVNSLMNSDSTDYLIDSTPDAESEVHAAINPVDSSNIIISTMRNNPSDFIEPLSFPTFYTKDFGRTWQKSTFNGLTPGEPVTGGGDPVIAFDLTGKAYLSWLTVNFDLLTFGIKMILQVAESTDGGATWTKLDPLDEGTDIGLLDEDADYVKLVDKEWLAVDHSDSPYQNTVYAAYVTIEADSTGANYEMSVRKKTSDMTRFTEVSVPANTQTYKIAQFASLDVDNEGVVHVSFAASLDSLNWAIYHTRSEDGGETFLPEEKVADLHIPRFSGDEPEADIVGIDPERLYPCPHLVVDKSTSEQDGTLHMVWTANGLVEKETEGLDIYYARSSDSGTTWTDARVLNDDTSLESHQFYPSISINKQGILVITWYDRREDPANVNTKYYMTYSEDGGETFVPNFAVSSTAADFSEIGSKNEKFGIGEYTQVITSDNYGIPVWADGRTNDGNIDIYVAFVPITDNVGSVSVSSIIKNFSLEGPFPNPTTAAAVLNLHLEEASHTDIRVYGLDGKLVQQISNQTLGAGIHQLTLRDLRTGEYFVTIATERGYQTTTLIVKQ